MTTIYDGYYLLDKRQMPPLSPNWYTSRLNPIQGIVMHTAENLPDITPPDRGAEAIADYGARATRSVSWHSTVDSDSIIPMLPDSYTAWHARTVNSRTLGIEMATQARKWDEVPNWYRVAMMTNAARVCAVWSREHDIPLVHLTMNLFNAGERGYLAHADVDPTRRSDPGWQRADWDYFFTLVEQEMGNMPDYTYRRGDRDFHTGGPIKRAQRAMKRAGFDIDVDGIFGPVTESALREFRRWRGFDKPDVEPVLLTPALQAELDRFLPLMKPGSYGGSWVPPGSDPAPGPDNAATDAYGDTY